MLTCRRDAFTASTACAAVQCGCTVRLQKSPGLGAAFTPWVYGGRISHCLAPPGEGQGKVPGAPLVHNVVNIHNSSPTSKMPARERGRGSWVLPRQGMSTNSSCQSCHWRQQERKADMGGCNWDRAAQGAGLCIQEHSLSACFCPRLL